jgi:hypothetical protein
MYNRNRIIGAIANKVQEQILRPMNLQLQRLRCSKLSRAFFKVEENILFPKRTT